MFDEDGCYLYVGRGVGVTVLPLRIGAPAEVPIVELTHVTLPQAHQGHRLPHRG